MARPSRGFSLLELLVTIVVIAILTGISIPILRGVFDRRRDAERVSNIRLTMVDFLTYAIDKDGVAPNVGVPGDDNTSPWYNGMTTPGDMMSMYLAITVSWPLYLNAHFGESHRFWHPPPGPRLPSGLAQAGQSEEDYGKERMLAMPSDYVYSECFVTAPELWTGEFTSMSLNEALAFARRVRFSQVAFPSSKGVLVHYTPLSGGSRASTSFADGSATVIPPENFLPPVSYPLGTSDEPFFPVLGTQDGHQGRDVSNSGEHR